MSFLLWLVFAIAVYFRSQTGILGKTLGGLVFGLFGKASYGLLPLLALVLLAIFFQKFRGKTKRLLFYTIGLFLCYMMILSIQDLPKASFATTMELAWERGGQVRGAGFLGGLLAFSFIHLLGKIGLYVLTFCIFLFTCLEVFDTSFVEFLQILARLFALSIQGLKGWMEELRTGEEEAEKAIPAKRKMSRKGEEGSEVWSRSDAEDPREGEEEDSQAIAIKDYRALSGDLETIGDPENAQTKSLEETLVGADPRGEDRSSQEASGDQEEVDFAGGKEYSYITPPLELLRSSANKNQVNKEGLEKQARKIEETLESFGISSQVVSIRRGPTVTQYELKPQAGVKVSRITNLSDDLALALAAQDIRIEAPIPGKPYVGVEVPNKESDTVALKDILQSQEFLTATEDLPVALGQSIEGVPVIAKIAKMPHLLIAGATGSGKSVCINAIIMSFLYRYAPSELRLLLIDPKVVELSVYNAIPHLLIPVVTDAKKAARALETLVREMERRFQAFSQYGVRDISAYRERRKVDEDMENMPYIVLIIDELSDLMMVASKDVEAYITRLAQMARACGIHLIIATQRPSVDVITGTIKANIPSRISFQVSSAVDSRTILDQVGAERLLGRGDMLYYPASFAKPKRVQAAYVSDQEVQDVVHFLSEQQEVAYDASLMESLEKTEDGADRSLSEEERDPLMEEVLDFISHEETTSISGLQRRFRIGYARAGRIIDDLEAMGAISPQDGSKARQVFLRSEGEEHELGK